MWPTVRAGKSAPRHRRSANVSRVPPLSLLEFGVPDLLTFLSFDWLSAETVWSLVPRILGATFVLAHLSLQPQALALGGERGITPLKHKLDRVRADFPGVRRFFECPTLLWLNCSDTMIRLLPLLGALGGTAAVYGGPLGFWGLLVAWACWLSLEQLGLVFPWDTMLMDAGFLGLFLPTVSALPALTVTELPQPFVVFMFQWLVIRLMWGFAKVKFVGTKPGDNLYLKTFMSWMPVPHPLGWYFRLAPVWLLRFTLFFMFFSEVIAPAMGFIPGWPRVVSFLGLSGLMVGIFTTGNWGFFNLGYIGVCLVLLDLQANVLDGFSAAAWATPGMIAINVAMLVLFVTSLFQFAANTWIARTWMWWNYDDVTTTRPWLRALIGYFRFIAPFRICNAYGVFPPNSLPPTRQIPVFEGSDDGQTWKAYPYRFIPTGPGDAPPIVAPHHPRLDHAIYYAGGGLHDGSLFGSIIGEGPPHSTYVRHCWLDRLGQRLLQGEPEVHKLFRENPFPDAPPKYVRLANYAMVPTSAQERADSGDWWRTRHIGNFVQPTELDEDMWNYYLPEPELFHADWTYWKNRSASLTSMVQAHEGAADVDDAVRTASVLTADDVEVFWDQFVPFVQEERDQWQGIEERVQALYARFDRDQRWRFERLLERYAWLLRKRIDPHLYRGKEPQIKARSNFRVHLLTHQVVMDGRQRFRAALAEPGRVAERAADTACSDELYAIALLRWEAIDFAIRTLRWSPLSSSLGDRQMPGIFEYMDLLIERPLHDEAWRPAAERSPSGEWEVPEMARGRDLSPAE